MKKVSFDIDHAIQMNKAGKTVRAIAKDLGVGKHVIYKRFASIGYTPTGHLSISADDIPAIISMYTSGASENAVATHFGVSRTAIRKALVDADVHVRTQSEAESLKWSQMTDKQRANQVKRAHQAVADKPPEFFAAAAIKQAKAKEKSLAKTGFMESEFISAFEKMGYIITPQKAVGPYNIDIAIGNAAIEVHINPSNPHGHPYYAKRVVDLLELGWHVIYIKITSDVLVERATEKVCAMLDLIRTNKPELAQYGVIRGTGELMASGCLDGNKLACVTGSDGFFASVK